MQARWCALLAPAAVLAAGCGKSSSEHHIARDRDAAAVAFIDDPAAGGEIRYGDEKEPNGEVASAGALAAGSGVKGVLDGAADVDLYAVDVARPGWLDAQLGGIEAVDLVLELRDAAGQLLARSDRGPAKIGEGLPDYAVQPGRYFLAVSEFVKPVKPAKTTKAKKPKKGEPPPPDAAVPAGRVGPSATYQLSVVLTPQGDPTLTDEREREPNEDAATAAEVLLAYDVEGFLGWAGDVDVWKLSLEGLTAQYSVDVDVSAVDGVAVTVEVLDGTGRSIIKRTGRRGGAVALRNLVPELDDTGKAGFYYARLTADRSNPQVAYRLRTQSRLLDLEEEVEPNDSPDSATPMNPVAEAAAGAAPQPPATAGVRKGFFSSGDVDHFQLEPPTEPVVLDVSVEPRGNADLVLEVGLRGGSTLGVADVTQVGGREAMVGIPIPAGKAAIVKLSGKAAKGSEGDAIPYELRWAVQPASAVAAPSAGSDSPATSPDDKGPGLDDEY